MESLPTPVFASHARSDSYRVGPWIAAMLAGGVRTGYEEDNEAEAFKTLQRSKVLVAFISAHAVESGPVDHDIELAGNAKKAVIIVRLDDTEIPYRPPNTTVIDVPAMGRRAAWDALVAALRTHGQKWQDPDSRSGSKRRRINERRSSIRARRWAIAAVIAWVALLIAYFAYFRPVEKETPKAELIPHAPIPVAETTPPAPPPAEPAKPAPTPAPETAPTMPNDPVKARDELAIQHIRNCIEASNRTQALTEEQIDKLVLCFTNPARIQDTGPRDHAGIKANLTLKQSYWPVWKETIDEATVVQRTEPNTVVVFVRSHGQGSNPNLAAASSMQLATRYTIEFTMDGKPLISAVFGEPVKEQ